VIGYVFWHAAPEGAALAEYEKTVFRFGGALANAKIPGFLGNASYAIGRTPWLGETGYEDWAWLEGSWALDALNERAVSGAMTAPHDAVAKATTPTPPYLRRFAESLARRGSDEGRTEYAVS